MADLNDLLGDNEDVVNDDADATTLSLGPSQLDERIDDDDTTTDRRPLTAADDDGDDGRAPAGSSTQSSSTLPLSQLLPSSFSSQRPEENDEDQRHLEDGGEDDDDDDDENEDGEDVEYAHLKSLWTTELSCPELVPHDADTFDLHRQLLDGQEEMVERLLSESRRGAADDGNDVPVRDARRRRGDDDAVHRNAALAASIYRMEADRVRFLLTDWTRIRLRKLEEHPFHYRERPERLSGTEISYLREYGELYERHLSRTVLRHLPREALRTLDDPEMLRAGEEVADDLERSPYVFCEILEDVVLDAGADESDDDDDDDMEEDEGPQDYAAGTSLIVRYGLVRNLVLEGKVRLLL